jgi:hypothetical protein
MNCTYESAGHSLAVDIRFPACLPMRALALGLITALAWPIADTRAVAPDTASRFQTSAVLQASAHALGQTWTVKNCNDNGPDSLRDVVENPLKAQSGDTVDLSELPTLCGMMDSIITLGTEIKIQQDDLYLKGPAEGTVAVSGAGMSRVLHHFGTGTLSLTALTVSNGYYHAAGNVYGGCVDSLSGRLSLNHVIVSQCTLASDDNGWAKGAGIDAGKDIELIASRITGNHAKDLGGGMEAYGGGTYSAGATFAKYSVIDHNGASNGRGGGLVARGGLDLRASTVESNTSAIRAGIAAGGGPVNVIDSTISHNSASDVGGGIFATYATLIANSTIAFNYQGATDHAGGVYFWGSSAADTLTLESSIIANNTAGPSNTPADVFIYPGAGSLAGTDNLVVASNVSDPLVITLTADPQLGPLRPNGGRTRTHMLLPGSPALGKGNTMDLPPTIATEQRGTGYPRTTGAGANVDLGAVQFDSIFADAFDQFYSWSP